MSHRAGAEATGGSVMGPGNLAYPSEGSQGGLRRIPEGKRERVMLPPWSSQERRAELRPGKVPEMSSPK